LEGFIADIPHEPVSSHTYLTCQLTEDRTAWLWWSQCHWRWWRTSSDHM